MRKWAAYGRLKEWLFDLEAQDEVRALREALRRNPNVTMVLLVVPGNDHGVHGR